MLKITQKLIILLTFEAKRKVIFMVFISRNIELCFACMETHIVYLVEVGGKRCKYCYRSDSLIQKVTENMTWEDVI